MVENNPEFRFLDKIKYIFTDPDFFFEKVKEEKGILNSFLFYLLLLVFFSVLGTFSYLLLANLAGSDLLFLGFLSTGALFFGMVGSIAISFIYAGLVFLFAWLFKGKGSYVDTYNVYAYSMTPYVMGSVIPFLGTLLLIYFLILATIGISKVHDLSKGKAFAAVFLPAFIVMGALILFFIILLALLFRGF